MPRSELQPTIAAAGFDQGDEADRRDAGADQPPETRIHRYLLSVALSQGVASPSRTDKRKSPTCRLRGGKIATDPRAGSKGENQRDAGGPSEHRGSA